jgi:hypothetical protein
MFALLVQVVSQTPSALLLWFNFIPLLLLGPATALEPKTCIQLQPHPGLGLRHQSEPCAPVNSCVVVAAQSFGLGTTIGDHPVAKLDAETARMQPDQQKGTDSPVTCPAP